MRTSFTIRQVKLEDELQTLCAKYEMGEARVKALVIKHRDKLNQKVKEAKTRGWNEWAAQSAELHLFRADAENRKDGHKFFKMDENNIHVLREDLTKEFHALAQTHTMVIGTLLEEFNDDQLLAIEMRTRMPPDQKESTGSYTNNNRKHNPGAPLGGADNRGNDMPR